MPRVSQLVWSFNGGELSPEFDGRVDQDKYKTGAKRIENFIVHPEGGVHRRPGTRHLTTVIDSTKKSKLVPFIFSTVQAYILEFSEFKIRIFADDLRLDAAIQSTVEEASAQTDEFELEDHGYVNGMGPVHITATAGLPAGLNADTTTDYWVVTPSTTVFVDADITGDVITAPSAHGYATEQGPFRLSTTGALPDNVSANLDYYVEAVSTTTFKLRLTPGGATVVIGTNRLGTHTMAATGDYNRDKFKLALTQGGTPINLTTNGTSPHTFTPNPAGSPVGIPLEINTPYTESEIYDLHFVQSADFLFIDHKNHRPAQLTRRGNTKWSFDFSSIFDGPYLTENTDEALLVTPSSKTGTDITLTLGTAVGFNDGQGWIASDIGRLFRLKTGSPKIWGHVEITGVQDVGTGVILIARATVRSDLNAIGASFTWNMGSWSNSNWPATLSFSDQRLWHAGEPETPQTLHGSETGLFTDFSPTEEDGVSLDTNGINFQIGANQVNNIIWLGTERQLFVGTPASVFVARASLDSEAITPDNINLPQMTAIGSSSIQPVTIGSNLAYMTRNSQGLRGIQFAADTGSFAPVDINLLAKHIFGRTETVTTMAFQFDRQQVLWLTRSDGVLVGVTYVPDQKVFAWHRHFVGGSFGSGDAVVESVAVIPSADGSYDQLWMIVKRTINGATVRHIEFMEDEWLDDVTTSMRFMDSSPAAYSGAATSTVTGLDHLEGETVQVMVDGAAHPDRTVSSGSITLNKEYTDVLVGLKYVSELETMRLEPTDPEGASMGKVARIDHVSLRFYKSLGGQTGPDVDNLDPIVFRSSGDLMDAPPPVFTGDKKIAFRGAFVREKVIVVRQDQPFPTNLLAMNLFMSTAER